MAIAPGTKAPDFTLLNTDKKPVTLKDFAGKKLIIHFFPAAFTGVCTEQLCSNRDELSFYNDLNAEVVGVSADMPFSLKVFKEQQHLNFDLLSDFNKDMIRSYDMMFEKFTDANYHVAKRGVVIINEEGNVAYSEETEHPGKQVDFEALKAALP